jgi:cobalt-zinc-cadmium efflux system outer membrane protein
MTWRQVAALSAGLCTLASLARAQTGGTPLGAADLVELALQRNREFLAAKERVPEAQGLLRQARLRPAPTIDVEESSGRPLGSRGEQVFSTGYSHTFETFGKRDKRIAVAEKSSEAVDADLADRTRLLTLDVTVQYARAVRDQLKRETLGRLAATNREYYTLTDVRVQRGDAPALEGQLFLTELNRVQAQQVVLTAGAERALIDLRKIVGLPITDPLVLSTAPPAATTARTLSELVAQALRDRPDLAVLRRLEEQATAEEALAHAEGKPNLAASARYSRVDSAFDLLGYDAAGQLVPVRARDHMLSVGLSVLLFAPKRNQGVIQAAQARTAAARLRREHLESVVRLEVEAAFGRWQAAGRAVDLLSQGVIGPSEQNLSVLRQAYAAGQLRVLDVLNEQRRLIDTELTYLDAQSELAEAFAELEAAVGGSLQ